MDFNRCCTDCSDIDSLILLFIYWLLCTNLPNKTHIMNRTHFVKVCTIGFVSNRDNLPSKGTLINDYHEILHSDRCHFESQICHERRWVLLHNQYSRRGFGKWNVSFVFWSNDSRKFSSYFCPLYGSSTLKIRAHKGTLKWNTYVALPKWLVLLSK